MDHTAYLILKRCGPCEGPCRIIQLSAATFCVPIAPVRRGETDREESRRICGFTVATETHV